MRNLNNYIQEGLKVNSNSKFTKSISTIDDFISKYQKEIYRKEIKDNFITIKLKKGSEIGNNFNNLLYASKDYHERLIKIIQNGTYYTINITQLEKRDMSIIIIKNELVHNSINIYIEKLIYDNTCRINIVDPYNILDKDMEKLIVKIFTYLIENPIDD